MNTPVRCSAFCCKSMPAHPQIIHLFSRLLATRWLNYNYPPSLTARLVSPWGTWQTNQLAEVTVMATSGNFTDGLSGTLFPLQWSTLFGQFNQCLSICFAPILPVVVIFTRYSLCLCCAVH